MFDLRQKETVDPMLTDLQIFMGMPDGDCWVDAELPTLFLYLYGNEKLVIPDEWKPAMQKMKLDMERFVTWLHIG